MQYASIIKTLPQEFQMPILELVEGIEGNLRSQLVARHEDFDRLLAATQQLVESQQRSDTRLTQLGDALVALARAQQRTEARVEELAAAQQRTEARVEELAAAQQRTEARLEELAAAQKQTEASLNALIQRVDKMDRKLDKHTGLFLELRYANRPHGYFGRILRRAHTVAFPEIEGQLEERLSEEELDDVTELDVIVRGRPKPVVGLNDLPAEVYLAIEVSATVDNYDVERAQRRAALMRRAGYFTVPVAAGEAVTVGGMNGARAGHVLVAEDGTLRNWQAAVEAAWSDYRQN